MAEGGFRHICAPDTGLWRIGRGSDPLQCRPPEPHTLISSKAGNRYDLNAETAGTIYFGSSLEVCFGEVLARHRPDPNLASLLEDEWHERHFMDLGAIPADWRTRRSAVRIEITDPAPFLDVEDDDTIAFLHDELAFGLSSLGLDTLTLDMIHGKDRRVTRLIASWAYNWTGEDENAPEYLSGIRYVSRIDPVWECWAVFGDTAYDVVQKVPITKDIPELQAIAKRYGLTVH